MARGGYRVAQVVQAVDEEHEVVAVAREARSVRNLEGNTVAHTRAASGVSRPHDRVVVEVETDEP